MSGCAPSPFEAAWAAIRTSLRKSCGARTFDGWLKPVTLAGFDSETAAVQLEAPSDFMASWVETHFADQLLAAWHAMLPQVRLVAITASSHVSRPALFADDEPKAESAAAPVVTDAAPAAP
jgi:chromosomal replication initiator protein